MIVYGIEKSSGSYDDYYSWIDFAFKSKKEAEKYVTKFNNLLDKLQKFYESNQSYDENNWIVGYHDIMHDKYYFITDISHCRIQEIEIR